MRHIPALGCLVLHAALASSAPAATFVVNSVGDLPDAILGDGMCLDVTGWCTLRAAMMQAQASTVVDSINFNIAQGCDASGVCSIELDPSQISLPGGLRDVIIDGTTQPGYSGEPLIKINGIVYDLANVAGLVLQHGNTVKGLQIVGFPDYGIILLGDHNLIEENHIGTPTIGEVPVCGAGGNSRFWSHAGIEVGRLNVPANDNTIKNNVIGCTATGVSVSNGARNIVTHNWIGIGKHDEPLGNQTGVALVGQGRPGFPIPQVRDNLIGGLQEEGDLSKGNVIAYNGSLAYDAGDGVEVGSSSGVDVNNAILGNSIFANGGVGISLNGGLGNHNQPAPGLIAASVSGGETSITVILGSNYARSSSFRIEYFASPDCYPVGIGSGENGDGKSFLGYQVAVTGLSGDTQVIAHVGAPPGGEHFITATATLLDTQGPSDTSPFSNCFEPQTIIQPGTLRFETDLLPVLEGKPAKVKVLREHGTDGVVSVLVSTVADMASGTSASQVIDYVAKEERLTWADGNGQAKEFTLDLVQDSEVETNERIAVKLSSPQGGALIGTPADMSVEIVDDECIAPDSGRVAFSPEDYTTSRAAGEAKLSVVHEGACPVLACYQPLASSTAREGIDYELPAIRRLRWARNDSRTQVLPVNLIGSGSEVTLDLELVACDGGSLDHSFHGSLLISNLPSLFLESQVDGATGPLHDVWSVDEGVVVTLHVTRVGPTTYPVEVDLRTSSRTERGYAVLEADFQFTDCGQQPGSDAHVRRLTVPAGQSRADCKIFVVRDDVAEDHELFLVSLSAVGDSNPFVSGDALLIEITRQDFVRFLGLLDCHGSVGPRPTDGSIPGVLLLTAPLVVFALRRRRRRRSSSASIIGLCLISSAVLGSAASRAHAETGDADHDGVLDSQDNCPAVQNPVQGDFDQDGHGDACSCGIASAGGSVCNAGTGVAAIEQQASDFRCGGGVASPGSSPAARCGYSAPGETCGSLGFIDPIPGSSGTLFSGVLRCQVGAPNGVGLPGTTEGICHSECFEIGGVPNRLCGAFFMCIGAITQEECVARSGHDPVFYAGAGIVEGTCDLETGTCSCPPMPCTPLECGDGNACTADVCNGRTGACRSDPIVVDDGDLCTVDGCDPASGPSHLPIVVDDGDLCTADGCDPASGPSHLPIVVDDGDLCTVDGCDPASGPSHLPIDPDDGDACSVDSCDPATGVRHMPLQCDDQDACTTETCDSSSGCGHGPVVCDDGDACNGIETCDSGSGCMAGAPPLEVCGGGQDEDCDGQVDCADADCGLDPACCLVVSCGGDTDPPVLVLPSDVVVEATSPDGAPLTYTVTASDAIDGVCDADGPCVLTCAPPSGSSFPMGATEVTCTATDQAGNSATGSFTVTVTDDDFDMACAATAVGPSAPCAGPATRVTSMTELRAWIAGPRTTDVDVHRHSGHGRYDFGGGDLVIPPTGCKITLHRGATFHNVRNVGITAGEIVWSNDLDASGQGAVTLRASSIDLAPASDIHHRSMRVESDQLVYRGDFSCGVEVALCASDTLELKASSTLRADRILLHGANGVLLRGDLRGAEQVTVWSEGAAELQPKSSIGGRHEPVRAVLVRVDGVFTDGGDIRATGDVAIETGGFFLARSSSFRVDGTCTIRGDHLGGAMGRHDQCSPGIVAP